MQQPYKTVGNGPCVDMVWTIKTRVRCPRVFRGEIGFVDNVDNEIDSLERDKNHILYIHTVVTTRTSRAHAPKGVDDLQLMVHMVHIVHKSTHARRPCACWPMVHIVHTIHARTALACWPMVHIVHSTHARKRRYGRLAPVGRWSTLSTWSTARPAAGADLALCFQPGGWGRADGREVTAAEGLQTFFIFCKNAIFGPCSKPSHTNRVNCARPRTA